VFGSGKRYFGSVGAQHLLEDPDVVIQGNRVLHLRDRVRVDRSERVCEELTANRHTIGPPTEFAHRSCAAAQDFAQVG
jgi:hypothetical protein